MAGGRSQILDQVLDALGPDGVDRISQQLGADRDTTERGIAASLPVLLGGLAREAETGRIDELDRALEQDHDGTLVDELGALLRGDGSARGPLGTDTAIGPQMSSAAGGAGMGLGGLLGGLLGGTQRRAANGDGILRHVLGGKRAPVEEGIGRASGLGGAQVSQLLALLAPMLMGVLGRTKRQRGLQGGGLADLLRQEREVVEDEVRQASGTSVAGTTSGYAGAAATAAERSAKPRGRLVDLLDSNRDGDIRDEVAKIGAAMAGAMILGKLHSKRR
jgi:hypothetical protein